MPSIPGDDTLAAFEDFHELGPKKIKHKTLILVSVVNRSILCHYPNFNQIEKTMTINFLQDNTHTNATVTILLSVKLFVTNIDTCIMARYNTMRYNTNWNIGPYQPVVTAVHPAGRGCSDEGTSFLVDLMGVLNDAVSNG